MKSISKRLLYLVFLFAILFIACEDKDDDRLEFEDLLRDESIYFSHNSDRWIEQIANLGSCYAVVNDKTNPSWCDIVVCTEDLKDFEVDLYGKYLFVHFDLDENKQPKNIIAEFYKNKSTQNAGEFDLMLIAKNLNLFIEDFDAEEISGQMIGQMQNKANSEDIRDVLFYFDDIKIKTPDELK